MSRKKPPERTVSFWQILSAKTRKPFEHSDWQSLLKIWAYRNGGARLTLPVEDEDLSGKVHLHNDLRHLVVTRNRDDLPRQQHRTSGDVTAVNVSGADWEVVESSFVSFLDFGNVFGFLQSQLSAASPQAVVKWINEARFFQDRLVAEPVIDRNVWERVRNREVVALELVGPAQSMPRRGTGPLAALSGAHDIGSFDIQVKIKTSKARSHAQERKQLHDAIEEILGEANLGAFKTAKATVRDPLRSGAAVRPVDLLKQRLSKKQTVALADGGTGTGSKAVTEMSAFDAILAVAEQLRDELRESVGDTVR